MAGRQDVARFIANYRDETDSAALYRAMAEAEPQGEIAEVYRRLARVEETHAEFWRRRIEQAGGRAPQGIGWRTRVLIWASRRFGAQSVLPLVADDEARNRTMYDGQQEAAGTALPEQERSHARMLSLLASRSSRGWNGAAYSRLEGRHGAGAANNLRAMVLGANDGLVSTFCLIMGVAGSAASAQTLLAAALAGMLAGACSMAMGEWISVQSARELQERQIASEAEELAEVPAEEQEELTLIYQAKGFSAEEARQIAARVIGDKDSALETLVREELGINPDDLGGSPMAAAASSFLVFIVGALIPALPMFLVADDQLVLASLLASATGLFALGAAIAVFTGKHPLFSGLRQLAIGLGAAGVTYGIGHLFGVAVGG
ncbi:rubrerythrin family protein [Pseudothauera nasutitermitis]|uniref:Rubrerythrin family protein n=1 Tax=Pseudothauera nasutitermitis TaxID=2565930 RepID=A0A4S4B5Z3_9RHOO|nr:VIT1/CCC1 transporter family protein [Pseudothauera nasutitermitis]THF66397.1 rubrerythrin family protein [Pseudothauera nasutitermitis]